MDILFGGQKELQVEVPAAADGQVRMQPNRNALLLLTTLPPKVPVPACLSAVAAVDRAATAAMDARHAAARQA